MKAKEYLYNIKNLQNQIDCKKETIETLESKLMPRSSGFGERVSASRRTDRAEEIMCKIADYKTELDNDIWKLTELKLEAITLIDKLVERYPTYAEVLHKRYIQNKRWEEISAETCFSVQNVYKLHGKALVQFDYILATQPKLSKV